MDMTVEIWAEIDFAPNYAVSNLGNVRNASGALLKPTVGKYGHQHVVLYTPYGRKCKTVHRLVCAAFNGPPPGAGYHAAHKDGKPWNNFPENLYWATPKENSADMIRHGTVAKGDRSGPRVHIENMRRGSGHSMAKLTEKDVLQIRSIAKQRGDSKFIAEEYGISKSLVNMIRRREVWTHI